MSPTKRPYAVLDIDGTLIRWQLYHALADTLVKQQQIDPLKYEAVLAMRMNWKNRNSPNSFAEYENSLVKLVNQSFDGLDYRAFIAACDSVIKRYRGQVYTYTRDLIASLKKQGYLVFAISGSPYELVKEICSSYKFDDFGATEHFNKDGKYKPAARVATDKNKAVILKSLITKHGATNNGSIAVGDTIGDRHILELVEQPIAFNPSRELFDLAQAKRWAVVIERKNMVYRLQYENGRYVLAAPNSGPSLI